MHLNPNPRLWKLAIAGSMLATMFGLNFVPSVQAATPQPVCNGNSCSITFTYTGMSTKWVPPAGITSLTFDVQGAQGGGSGSTGGLGGRVTGRFLAIPADVTIYVGNKGSNGNGVVGGFNGGGTAGVGNSSVGSGGGASDLRSGSQASTRIVVAGGGGGSGAGDTGEVTAGGHGGGLVGQAGGSGLATGGSGGTSSAGGAAGAVSPAGGGAGSAGSLSNGGNGGTGTLNGFGGGGGGGGYYGGGGGGGDSASADLDAGAGGGGSSYASATLVTDVVHTQGFRTGAGQVTLTYTTPPVVTNFKAKKAVFPGQAANFDLTLDQPVSGLEIADFRVTGSAIGCTVQLLTVSPSQYEVIVNACDASSLPGKQGTVGLVLNANSVVGDFASVGPQVEAVSDIADLDQYIPTASIESPAGPTSTETQQYLVSFDEPVTGFEPSDLTVDGASCRVSSLTNPSLDRQRFIVIVDSCADDALLTLTVLSGMASDVSGNLAPLASIASPALQIDRVAPVVSSLQARPWRTGQNLLVDLSLSEVVTATRPEPEAFKAIGDGCEIAGVEANGSGYLVTIRGCHDGALAALEVAAGSFIDPAGNSGPSLPETSAAVLIDLSAPTLTFGSITQFTPQSSPSFNFWFSEQVSGFDESDIALEGTAGKCTASLSTISEGREFQLETFGCEPGTVEVRIWANAAEDASGNLGPATEWRSAVATVQEAPVSPPEPEPTPSVTPITDPSPSETPPTDPSPSETPSTNPTPTVDPSPTPSVTETQTPSPKPTATITARPRPQPVVTVIVSPNPTNTPTAQPKPAQSTTPPVPGPSTSSTPRVTTTPGQRYDYRDLPDEEVLVVTPDSTDAPLDFGADDSDSSQVPSSVVAELPTEREGASAMVPFMLTGAAVFALVGGYAGLRIGRRRKAEVN